MTVYIIGMGPGRIDLVTVESKEALAKCTVLIGHPRLTGPWQAGKRLYGKTKPSEIRTILASLDEREIVGIVVSGDTGFYSLATSLADLPYDVHICPGISSLSYFASKIKMPWQDAALVSRHGRKQPFVSVVYSHQKTFCLTGGTDSVSSLCADLVAHGFGQVTVYAGCDLSYGTEKIEQGTAEEMAAKGIDGLAVMMVLNEDAKPLPQAVPGLPDDAFQRGDVPMTKEEIRAVAMCKLRPEPEDVLYDIGAGTGSCSVEMARMTPFGQVFSFEVNEKALELLYLNKERFALNNMTIVAGEASQHLEDYPVPDKAFIGGTKGHLATILDAIYQRNKSCKIVLTAITIETLATITTYYKDKQDYSLDITSLTTAKSKKTGPYHLMKAQNPVYIITASR